MDAAFPDKYCLPEDQTESFRIVRVHMILGGGAIKNPDEWTLPGQDESKALHAIARAASVSQKEDKHRRPYGAWQKGAKEFRAYRPDSNSDL